MFRGSGVSKRRAPLSAAGFVTPRRHNPKRTQQIACARTSCANDERCLLGYCGRNEVTEIVPPTPWPFIAT